MDQNVNTERILNGFNVFWWAESGIVLTKPNLMFFSFCFSILNICLVFLIFILLRFCLQTNKSEIKKKIAIWLSI